MKRFIALFCALIIAGAVCSACGSKPKENGNTEPTGAAPTAAPAETVAATQEAEATVAPATQEVLHDPASAQLSDLVKNAKESVIVQPGGGEKRCAIPEILLDSSDAKAANSEIMEKHGDYFEDPSSHEYVNELNYEAYLFDKYLSVYIKSKVDGGNTSGLCYCFDITTGSELNGETLCSMTGRDYNTAIGTLKTNLTSYYDEKYSRLPNNDDYRNKTLSDSNVNASKLFLDDAHKLTAMVNIYAAVGGGNWVVTIPAE